MLTTLCPTVTLKTLRGISQASLVIYFPCGVEPSLVKNHVLNVDTGGSNPLTPTSCYTHTSTSLPKVSKRLFGLSCGLPRTVSVSSGAGMSSDNSVTAMVKGLVTPDTFLIGPCIRLSGRFRPTASILISAPCLVCCFWYLFDTKHRQNDYYLYIFQPNMGLFSTGGLNSSRLPLSLAL